MKQKQRLSLAVCVINKVIIIDHRPIYIKTESVFLINSKCIFNLRSLELH